MNVFDRSIFGDFRIWHFYALTSASRGITFEKLLFITSSGVILSQSCSFEVLNHDSRLPLTRTISPGSIIPDGFGTVCACVSENN